jgi:hypothetical protein
MAPCSRGAYLSGLIINYPIILGLHYCICIVTVRPAEMTLVLIY